MKKIQGIIFSVFLLMVLFLPIKQGECYVTLKYKDVPLNIGTMKLPQDAQIKEFDVKAYSNFFLGKVDRDVEEMAEYIKFYQIAINDGENNRVAYFITFFNAEYKELNEASIGEKERAEILAFQAKARERIAWYIEEAKSEKAESTIVEKVSPENFYEEPIFTYFEWPDMNFMTINGKQACSSEMRIAGEFGGLFLALYGNTYFFNINDSLGILAFVTVDSERDFWQAIFAKSINDGIKY